MHIITVTLSLSLLYNPITHHCDRKHLNLQLTPVIVRPVLTYVRLYLRACLLLLDSPVNICLMVDGSHSSVSWLLYFSFKMTVPNGHPCYQLQLLLSRQR
ncbi:hypothetical protein CHARACLAT_017909 [Characodon lateralis]|uniref:Secreted protein n=1 Tax=Characodon lateralis TaxID=208331 RepID=A0ABU7CPX9_9TELE|nr:hypothetical protein [Characodon lateralis]